MFHIDFLNVLWRKVLNQPYEANLLFSNSKRITHNKNDKGDYLPIKVIIRLLQRMTVKDSTEYWDKLFETLRFILKLNNQLVDDYINNEGELWEIFISTFDKLYRGLPSTLTMNENSPLNVSKLIKENYPFPTQHNNYSESYNKFIHYVIFFDEWIFLIQNKEIVSNITNLFFNDFLMNLQKDFGLKGLKWDNQSEVMKSLFSKKINNSLDNDEHDLTLFRTTMQYLIQLFQCNWNNKMNSDKNGVEWTFLLIVQTKTQI